MPSDSERLRALMKADVLEGFACLPRDRYDYASEVAELNGHEEPTETDELDGFRQMIDDYMAMEATNAN